MYSYEVFSKINKIEEHLVDFKPSELDGYSNHILKDIRDYINASSIINHLSDENINDLKNGKEIIITVQTTQTLKIKKRGCKIVC